jgi:hypothetical protein
MPQVELSKLQGFRTGYTPVRVPTAYSTKMTGIMIWSRHCLVLSGGVLLREVIDSILVVAPGDVDQLVVDPLSDTRIMKGDFQTPGAKLVRFMAFDGMNQDCRNVEMVNQDMNPVSTSSSVIPVEYLRLRETLVDGQSPAIAPGHTDIARGASTAFSTPAPWSTNKDWFFTTVLNFEDLGDPDFCQRIVVTLLLAGVVRAVFKLPIPHLMIRAQMGDVLTQQLTLGTELSGTVDQIQIEEEGTGQQPNVCVVMLGSVLRDVCSYRVDDPTTGMKLIRLRDMLNTTAQSLEKGSAPSFNSLETKDPQERMTGSISRDARRGDRRP